MVRHARNDHACQSGHPLNLAAPHYPVNNWLCVPGIREALEYERAAALRDRIEQLRKQMGNRVEEAEVEHATRGKRGRHQGKRSAGGRIPRPKKQS